MGKLKKSAETEPASPGAPVGSYPSGVRMSNDHYMERFRAILCGPTGCGKTFCAATMSKHLPKELKTFKKEVVLSDLLSITIDAGGNTGLGQYNISMPEISLREDLMCPPKRGQRKKFYTNSLIQAMAHILSTAQDMVCNHGVETVILDTASQLNGEICAFWDEETRRPADDRKYWRLVMNTERQFFPLLLGLPCNLIILSHEKPVLEAGGPGSKQLETVSPVRMPDFRLDIAGSALRGYYQNMDVVMSLSVSKGLRGQGYIRKLHPYEDDGRATKCRLQHLLSETEEPHLGDLVKRLRQRKQKA